MMMPTVPMAVLVAVAAALAAALLTGRLHAVAEAESALYRACLHVPLAALLGTGAALVAETWAEVLAYGILAVACALLIVVDLAEHRLPNVILGRTCPILLAAFTLAAVVGTSWGDLGRAVLAMVVLTAAYLVLALIAPSGIGMGDVKFSGLLGMALGWSDWNAVVLGTVAAFALNGIVALGVLLARRDRGGEVPFGPAMVVGAMLGLATTLT
jgi:leader peptidase (prepilin peptidase)/N-methyltransferase